MNKKAIKELKAKIAKGANPINAAAAVSKKYHVSYSDIKFYAGL